MEESKCSWCNDDETCPGNHAFIDYLNATDEQLAEVGLRRYRYELPSVMEDDVRSLLAKISIAFAFERKDEAFDLLSNAISLMLKERNFEKLGFLTKSAVTSNLPLKALVGVLTATLQWKERLAYDRKALIEVVRSRAMAKGGLQKANALLSGLE